MNIQQQYSETNQESIKKGKGQYIKYLENINIINLGLSNLHKLDITGYIFKVLGENIYLMVCT